MLKITGIGQQEIVIKSMMNVDMIPDAFHGE